MAFQVNLTAAANNNEHFRHVLHTGLKSQLVVMSIPPGGDVGTEVHQHVEQTFFVVSGSGQAIVDNIATPLATGDCLVVPPGAEHNLSNSGQVPLKLMTVYTPPNHIDGRVHDTKAEAEADTADEAFGQAVV